MARYRTKLVASTALAKPALFWGVLLLAVGSITARGDDLGRSPARLVPARGLTAYLEYDGLDAHADAWKATAAWRIVNGTPAGAILTDVARQTLDRLFKVVPGNPFTGADLVALEDHLVHHGVAAASYREDGKSFTVFIFNNFDRKETREHFDHLLQCVLRTEEGQPLATPAPLRGRNVSVFHQPEKTGALLAIDPPRAGPTWWLEGNALILVSGPKGELGEALYRRAEITKDLDARQERFVHAVLDAIEGKTPNALVHPGVVAARAEGRDIPGFEPSGCFVAESDKGVIDALRVDAAGPNELDLAAVLGLGQATRILGRWGFRGQALVTDLRFKAPGPWKGVAGMLASAGVRKDRVPPIPRRMGAFGIGSFRRALDPESMATLRPLIKADSRPYLEAAERVLADQTNRRVLENLVSRLGPTWCVYAAPGVRDDKEGVPTLLVGIDDVAALERALATTVSRLNQYFYEEEFGKGAEPEPGADPPVLALERLPAPERGYRLTSPSNRVPWLTDRLQPTILLGKSFAVVAANPALARAAIAAESRAEDRWEPSGECAKLFECLPTNLSFLMVGNPRDSSWPEAIVNLPRTAAPSLGRFVGADLGEAPPEAPSSELLSLLGVPPAGASRAKGLKTQDIRSLIFPSVLAATVSDRDVRILTLEALPFGCVGLEARYEAEGRAKSLTIELKIGGER